LEDIELGLVYDMIIEKTNDECEYDTKASQQDIDILLG